MSSTNIHQHIVKKRVVSEVGSPRPSKRHRASALVGASTSAVEPDAPSTSVPEPVLVLSTPTVLFVAPSKERTTRGATETISVVLPPEEVRAKAREPEQSVVAPVASSVGA